MVVDDEVITKVSKAGIPAGIFGVVESVDEDGIWVDVFIPADDGNMHTTKAMGEQTP